MKRKLRFEFVEPIPNPCPICEGFGSEWKRRKDGQQDRRYFFPIGPCPACNGTGRAA